mmetsp:Transcript_133528/g.316527  ORF Transcript_133528/g.316527 Transcript_133528/m.316527 type:complete len:231 (+) Transcript_133528:191-883(+)
MPKFGASSLMRKRPRCTTAATGTFSVSVAAGMLVGSGRLACFFGDACGVGAGGGGFGFVTSISGSSGSSGTTTGAGSGSSGSSCRVFGVQGFRAAGGVWATACGVTTSWTTGASTMTGFGLEGISTSSKLGSLIGTSFTVTFGGSFSTSATTLAKTGSGTRRGLLFAPKMSWNLRRACRSWSFKRKICSSSDTSPMGRRSLSCAILAKCSTKARSSRARLCALTGSGSVL